MSIAINFTSNKFKLRFKVNKTVGLLLDLLLEDQNTLLLIISKKAEAIIIFIIALAKIKYIKKYKFIYLKSNDLIYLWLCYGYNTFILSSYILSQFRTSFFKIINKITQLVYGFKLLQRFFIYSIRNIILQDIDINFVKSSFKRSRPYSLLPSRVKCFGNIPL